MSKLITFLTVLFLTGCYGSQIAELREENRRLRAAQADGWQPPGHPAIPSQSPTAPSVAGPTVVGGNVGPGGMVGNGQGSSGAMIARRQHGIYMGTTGAQARQVTMGPKLRLDNHVCDNGSRGWDSTCSDHDRNGAPDYNTFLAFQIDGQPVVCDSPFVHPDTGEVLLQPGQTCFVELGRSSVVNLTIRAYRNFGTSASIMLDAAPDATSHRRVDIGAMVNTAYFEVDESRF